MSGDPLALLDTAPEISITEHHPRVTEGNQEKLQYFKITAEFRMEDNSPKLLCLKLWREVCIFQKRCGVSKELLHWNWLWFLQLLDLSGFSLLKYHQICKAQTYVNTENFIP